MKPLFGALGNELSGNGVGAHVHADRYGKDLIHLKKIIKELNKGSPFEPSLVAPGGFFNQQWFTKLLQVSGSNVLDAVSHHIYNLGAGEFRVVSNCFAVFTCTRYKFHGSLCIRS